jgi:polyhydroxyalkanoate synthase
MSSEPEGPLTPGPLPDFEALAANTARLMEELGHATAASIKPIEEGRAKPGMSDEVSDIVKTLGQVVEQIAADPQRLVVAQTSLTIGFLDLWSRTLKRYQG